MRAVALAIIATSLGAPALAQTITQENENVRYSFAPVADGALRLDTRTGAVSLCQKQAVGWSCQSLPDDRAAFESEIARLQDQNAALKKELASRGIPVPGDRSRSTSRRRTDGWDLKLPSDAEIDRMMSFFEKIWRRLIEMVQSVQRDSGNKI
jgi:hypothetical protein